MRLATLIAFSAIRAAIAADFPIILSTAESKRPLHFEHRFRCVSCLGLLAKGVRVLVARFDECLVRKEQDFLPGDFRLDELPHVPGGQAPCLRSLGELLGEVSFEK